MITVYGTPICKDCLVMKIIFERLGVKYQYINITKNTTNLREFLKNRDNEEIYQSVKENNGVGIPFFVKGDLKTFDINQALAWEDFEPINEDEIGRITKECELLFK